MNTSRVKMINLGFVSVQNISCQIMIYMIGISVSEDEIQKNLTSIGKSLNQLEIDIKNQERDKTTLSNDSFGKVMDISFFVKT